MPARRSTLNLILAALTAIRDGCDKPTRIMYACNMSWKSMKKMLKKVTEKGYVVEVEHHGNKRSTKRYIISKRGKNILRHFEEAKDQIGVDIHYIIS